MPKHPLGLKMTPEELERARTTGFSRHPKLQAKMDAAKARHKQKSLEGKLEALERRLEALERRP